MDAQPTHFTLVLKVLSTGSFPVQLKIYNRTLVGGEGSLYSTQSVSSYSSFTLRSGRYSTMVKFSHGKQVEEEFRVHDIRDDYCEGVCYLINNADFTMSDPVN